MHQRDSLGLGEQLQKEWRRAGINFRVMLVGESGLGKTTFTRALLRPYVPEHKLDLACSKQDLSDPVRARTVGIQEIKHSVENDGFPVDFEIIDCPGYGDSVDESGWIDMIRSYIVKRFENHYDALGNPPKMDGEHTSMNALQRDGLVHVCLYFIAAHRLKGVDLEFMRRLEPYVNLVPVIAKSDTMTLAERDAFRRLVLAELRKHNVRIFELSAEGVVRRTPSPPTPGKNSSREQDLSSLDEGPIPSQYARKQLTAANELGTPPTMPAPQGGLQAAPRATTQPPPFAVCASEDGTRVYPWGTCCAEDPTHSDLSTLRSMLFASSMVQAKRDTLQLYEASYAQARRVDEAAHAARQARALRREQLIGKMAVLTVATSAVGLATAGAVAVVHPEIAAAGMRALTEMVDTLKDPQALLSSAARGILGAIGALVERARNHRALVPALKA